MLKILKIEKTNKNLKLLIMIKIASFKTELDIPFTLFKEKFNLDIHFALKGIKKRFYHNGKLEPHPNKINAIRVFEKGPIHCNYFPNEDGKTCVEYTTEFTFFEIILWIISLFLIIGFLYIPVRIIGSVLSAKKCTKNVVKNGSQAIIDFYPEYKTQN